MSDTPGQERPKGEPAISRADLERFFLAQNVDHRCPCCGADKWEVMTDEAVEGVAMFRLGGDALVYNESILPALVLICDRCAHLWLVARKRVAVWLSENPRTDS